MNKTIWECQKCGSQSPKWAGRCPECGAWGSLVEEISEGRGTRFDSARREKEEGRRKSQTNAKPQKLSEILKTADTTRQRISTGIGELDRVLGAGMVPGAVMLLAGEPGMGKSTLLSQVALQIAASYQSSVFGSRFQVNQFSVSQLKTDRLKTEKPETENRQPKTDNRTVLYVCGEESPSQVAMRLKRLSVFGYQLSDKGRSVVSSPVSKTGRQKTDKPQTENRKLKTDNRDNILLFPETDVDAVASQLEQLKPSLVIIDSIQTMFTNDLSGMAGAVGQIRECAGRLSQIAKAVNIPLFLVGHVTKEGDVAGPKVLEHVVDVVLVMEGQRSGALRMVRAVKNRFGPVDEVGLFAMEEGGMREVKNPAELLIGEHAGNASGSVLGCVLEGQRPLVLEIQALVVPSKIAVPRRVGQGINERRLQLLCAVIKKHLGLGIGEKDVFVNVAGGLRSQDPGLDLAVVAAIVSSCAGKSRSDIVLSRVASRATSLSDRPIRGSKLNSDLGMTGDQFPPKKISSLFNRSNHSSHFNHLSSRPIFCGEVGLLGEVRMVAGWERREKEVQRLKLGHLVGKNELHSIRELREFL